MGRVAVIGRHTLVAGYELAGALVLPAEDDDAVRVAWNGLPDDVEIVVLTAEAARALGAGRTASLLPLTVEMPS
ncbi:hypothetical protein [Rhodococcus opacus]|uniref:hypothetical protein n=1 Tax=Rhodococcus opacus TaxID=37919 RepID=UPI002236807E|nr:hypothetical protein [Rhodococcus opacus]UZG55246.1 hypothetical protein ONE62_35325 [Rhodococcus opacus]